MTDSPVAGGARVSYRPIPAAMGEIAVVAVAAAAAGSTFHRAFGVGPLVAIVGVSATLAPVLLALCSGWTSGRGRVIRHLMVAASAVLLLAVLLPLDHLPPRGFGSCRHLGASLLDSPVCLLSLTLPAPAVPELLVVPAAFTWLAAWLGATLILRARRPGALVALLPVAPCWVYTTVLGGNLPPGNAAAALTTAGCVAVLLVRGIPAAPLSTRTPGRIAGPTRWGRSVAPRLRTSLTVLVVAAAVFAVTGVASRVQPRPAPDPRQYLGRVPLAQPAINPLDWVGAWLADPDRLLFHAHTDRDVTSWRLATLDGFDGQRWFPPSSYAPAGLGVPFDDGPGGMFTTVAQTVQVEGLEGPFVPSVERPYQIGPPITAVDVRGGTLVTDRSDRPLAYTVLSQLRPTLSTVDRSCRLGQGGAVAVTEDLRLELRRLSAGVRCDGASMRAYADAVESRLRVSPGLVVGAQPPRGTSAGALVNFLTGTAAGSIVEYAESFALALALAGIPTRLVVGFGTGAPVADGWRAVRGRDVRVWVDVLLPDGGWVAYYLTPPITEQAPRPDPPSEPDPPRPMPDVIVPPSFQPPLPPEPYEPIRWQHVVEAGRTVLWVAGSLALAYLVAVSLVPLLRRFARRVFGRRRRRVLGAWYELLDELARGRDPGTVPRLITATPESIEDMVRERLADAAADSEGLAAAVDAALFGRVKPAAGEVSLAWRRSAAVRRRLRRRRHWYVRVWRRLSPGSLRPRPLWR